MSAVAIGLVMTALVFVGGVAGMHLHRFLPPEHLSKKSRDVVMLGTGMLSVLASLVLGLLIATAKSSYDTKDANLRSFAADMIVLDETLRDDGDEALAARRALRDYANQLLRDVWPETGASPYLIENKEAFKCLERMRGEIEAPKVANEDQGGVTREFEAHVMAGIANERDRQDESQRRIGDAEIERRRPQAVALRDVPGEEGGEADGKIPGELVEADR